MEHLAHHKWPKKNLQAAAQEMLAQVALQRQELTEAAPKMAPFFEAGDLHLPNHAPPWNLTNIAPKDRLALPKGKDPLPTIMNFRGYLLNFGGCTPPWKEASEFGAEIGWLEDDEVSFWGPKVYLQRRAVNFRECNCPGIGYVKIFRRVSMRPH